MTAESSYRWFVVSYTMLIQAISFGIPVFCFALFVIPWLDGFGVSSSEIMLAPVVSMIVLGLFSPFAGNLFSRYSSRLIVLTGLISLVLGLLLVTQASAWWQILVLYATLLPIGMTLMGPLTAQTLVTRWFESQRGIALGITATGTTIGGIIFPLIVARFLTDFDWRDVLAWMTGICVVLAGPSTWFVLSREPCNVEESSPAFNDEPQITTRGIVSSSSFWIPAIYVTLMSLIVGAIQHNIGIISQDLELSAESAGGFVALTSAAMILGKLMFGALGDRIEYRYLIWISISFILIALTLLMSMNVSWMFGIALLFLGLANGGIVPIMALVYGSHFGVIAFARVMGLALLIVTLGAFGPLIAGWIYDAQGSFTLAFQLFAITIAIFATVTVRLKRPEAVASLVSGSR